MNSSSCINDEQEKEHFNRVVDSFRFYHFFASKRVAKSLKGYQDLSENQRKYLNDFEDTCKELLTCVDENKQVIDLILRDVEWMFENADRNSDNISNSKREVNFNLNFTPDVDRVNTTLKQIVRDWSSEGLEERKQCYGLILDELKKLYPNVKSKNNKPEETLSVLVPGAGLGRLAFEIALLGFTCQGNEFSTHMLIVSNFILNKCHEDNQYKIYPFANSWCNNYDSRDQLRQIRFPDVSPSNFSNELDRFSMTAGDFLQVYNETNEWNCVVTCYFLDTAHNIIDYVEKIWNILKPNGYWINFGPLMYHFSEMPSEESIELSYEQIKRVIKKVGFKYLVNIGKE